MSHARIRDRLSAYLDGDLTPRQERRVARHLATCEDCARELRQVRDTVALLRALPAEDPPYDLAERIVARVVAQEDRSVWLRVQTFVERQLWAPWVAPVAATALGLVVFGWVQSMDVSLTAGLPVAQATAPGVPRVSVVAPPTPRAPAGPRVVSTGGADLAKRNSRVPSMASCIAGRPDGSVADPEGCAAWYSLFVGTADDDPTRFVDEVNQLAPGMRAPWLQALSIFSGAQGSEALAHRQLRSSDDPVVTSLAPRYQRSPQVLVQPVGFGD